MYEHYFALRKITRMSRIRFCVHVAVGSIVILSVCAPSSSNVVTVLRALFYFTLSLSPSRRTPWTADMQPALPNGLVGLEPDRITPENVSDLNVFG